MSSFGDGPLLYPDAEFRALLTFAQVILILTLEMHNKRSLYVDLKAGCQAACLYNCDACVLART